MQFLMIIPSLSILNYKGTMVETGALDFVVEESNKDDEAIADEHTEGPLGLYNDNCPAHW